MMHALQRVEHNSVAYVSGAHWRRPACELLNVKTRSSEVEQSPSTFRVRTHTHTHTRMRTRTHTHARTRTRTRTHTHTFNSPFSGTTQVSRYQKGETNLDFTEARDSEWQWHQLGHMQVCASLQTDNHASTPPLSFIQAGCPSCRPTNSINALKANLHSARNNVPLTEQKKVNTKHPCSLYWNT